MFNPAESIVFLAEPLLVQMYALADLGGGVRDARPPLGVQILSISCSFRENLACSRPPWRVHAPPPLGKILDPPLVCVLCMRVHRNSPRKTSKLNLDSSTGPVFSSREVYSFGLADTAFSRVSFLAACLLKQSAAYLVCHVYGCM